MQPTYIPWIGYFDMIDKVDVFIFYDDVQLTKRSWQVRNKLRNKSGEYFLSIPIKKTASRGDLLIKDAVLNNNEKWKETEEFLHLSFADVREVLHGFLEELFFLWGWEAEGEANLTQTDSRGHTERETFQN